MSEATSTKLDDGSLIHPTALIDPSATLGDGVRVGPYSIVGPGCVVGARTSIGPHVVLEGLVTLGEDCEVRSGAVLGGPPQDYKFKGEPTRVVVGDRTHIREMATIHRATGEGEETTVGDDCLVMAYVHVGHNCRVGSHVMLSSFAGLAGHVTIDDHVVIGGMVGLHQFVRVGRYAMVGAYSKVVQDVPPFMLADGRPADILELNIRGLRRAGIPPKTRAVLRNAYKLLYRSKLNTTQALAAIAEELESNPELDLLVRFIQPISSGNAGRQNDRPKR
jgi:UDP-N-acetylglucosamine acyltransferase